MKTELELVEACLAGNQRAFGTIVERYQSLICAIAYSTTGDLGVSEDLAQETFVTAWKRLGELRDRTKLRAWLCGIARNLTNNWIRQRTRDIVGRAAALDQARETSSTAPSPREQAISKEQEAILWGALEQIPETYREPLVIYYREQQSVHKVAEALELSEEAVKQRLSRGRKMLKEQLAAFVEETLVRTGPKKAFTIAVLAAIPAAAPKAAAAGVAATAAKAVTAASAAGFAGGLLGTIGGLLGSIIGTRASIIKTKSPRERKFMVKMSWILYAGILGYLGILWMLIVLARSYPRDPTTTAYVVVTATWFVGLVPLIFWTNYRQRQIQIEDGTYVKSSFQPLVMPRAAVFANTGGSVLGSVLWLVILACIAKDWTVAAAVAAVAVAIFLVSANFCLRVPDHYYRVAMGACSAVGVLNLVVFNLRWNRWLGLYRQSVHYRGWSDLPLPAMNVLIVAIISGLLLLFFFKDRSQRAELHRETDRPHG